MDRFKYGSCDVERYDCTGRWSVSSEGPDCHRRQVNGWSSFDDGDGGGNGVGGAATRARAAWALLHRRRAIMKPSRHHLC